MARYLDPKNDFLFKRIFGEHEELCISFLNELLPLGDGQRIETLHYILPEQVPATPFGKNAVVDVKCKDNRGRTFIVEMQMQWNRSFAHRLIFNSATAYVRQFERKSLSDHKPSFHSAEPVYSLAILSTNVPGVAGNKWYHHYKIADIENPTNVIEGLDFILVELPKFMPTTWNQIARRMAVLWLRFLAEIDAQDVSDELLNEPTLRQAIELCEIGALTPDEKTLYDAYFSANLYTSSLADVEEDLSQHKDALAEANAKLEHTEEDLAEANAKVAEATAKIAELEQKVKKYESSSE
jgi:predicted transposase/invertase (TIGR01784 family)